MEKLLSVYLVCDPCFSIINQVYFVRCKNLRNVFINLNNLIFETESAFNINNTEK